MLSNTINLEQDIPKYTNVDQNRSTSINNKIPSLLCGQILLVQENTDLGFRSKPYFSPYTWKWSFRNFFRQVRLKKLVWLPSISAQVPETFDPLWAKPSANLVFRPQSKGGQNLPSRARNTKWHFWASLIWHCSKRKAKGRRGTRNTEWHLWASTVPAFGGRFRGPVYI